MSRAGAYGLVLSGVFHLSGKHLQNRTAIYPLYVFPNVSPCPSRSDRGVSSPKGIGS
jgi:hypothetical protein